MPLSDRWPNDPYGKRRHWSYARYHTVLGIGHHFGLEMRTWFEKTYREDMEQPDAALENMSPTDRLVVWRMADPRFKTRAQLRRDKMQRQFTIDIRVDYVDPGKNDEMRKAMARAARHILTTARLMTDGQQPQIACYSDDHFAGHDDIDILDDVITKGFAEIGSESGEAPISAELLEAAQEANAAKPNE